jgi:hypothetical protein
LSWISTGRLAWRFGQADRAAIAELAGPDAKLVAG